MKNLYALLLLSFMVCSFSFGQGNIHTAGTNSGNVKTKNNTYSVQGSFGDPLLIQSENGSNTVTSGFWTTVFPGEPGWAIPVDTSVAPILENVNVGSIEFGVEHITLTNQHNKNVAFKISIFDIKGQLVSLVAQGNIHSGQMVQKMFTNALQNRPGAFLVKIEMGSHVESRVFNYIR